MGHKLKDAKFDVIVRYCAVWRASRGFARGYLPLFTPSNQIWSRSHCPFAGGNVSLASVVQGSIEVGVVGSHMRRAKDLNGRDEEDVAGTVGEVGAGA